MEARGREWKWDGRKEWEAGQDEPEGARAHGTYAQGATVQEQTAEVTITATTGAMRGIGEESSATERSNAAQGSAQHTAGTHPRERTTDIAQNKASRA